MNYQERTYRSLVNQDYLSCFKVIVKETDILVHVDKKIDLTKIQEITKKLVLKYRNYIELYIKKYPEFATTLVPWRVSDYEIEPKIITDMIRAGIKAKVGPMASVAGAISEHVGRELLKYSKEIIIENGGDIFIAKNLPIKIGIFAGNSPFSLKIALNIDPKGEPISVCTSSGTVGHSLSFGKADAVCVVSKSSCSLADAYATAICNKIKSLKDIEPTLEFAKNLKNLDGILIIIKDKLGVWGDVELVPVNFN